MYTHTQMENNPVKKKKKYTMTWKNFKTAGGQGVTL